MNYEPMLAPHHMFQAISVSLAGDGTQHHPNLLAVVENSCVTHRFFSCTSTSQAFLCAAACCSCCSSKYALSCSWRCLQGWQAHDTAVTAAAARCVSGGGLYNWIKDICQARLLCQLSQHTQQAVDLYGRLGRWVTWGDANTAALQGTQSLSHPSRPTHSTQL